MSLISQTVAWHELLSARDRIQGETVSAMFAADAGRAESFSLDLSDLYLDFARQRVDANVFDALVELAETAGVSDFMRRMTSGDLVNSTEGRAALHTASRGFESDHQEISDVVDAGSQHLQAFVDGVHQGQIKTAAGGLFKSVVAIGIGGSELGPALALDALKDDTDEKLDVRVCGNIDGIAFKRAFHGLDPSSTMVIVISKSFTTLETTLNARRAKVWMQDRIGDDWVEHFVGVSANLDETAKFGIKNDRVFPLYDWVGGRYSLWSAVGLPVALAYGWSVFSAIRDGAREIDEHALSAPLAQNAPVIMALLTVWNASFLGYQAEACTPYDTRLAILISHLQQLEMESNGKRVTHDGLVVDYPTQPVVFGGVGVNVQHAFFQQMHQGTTPAPIDFLIPACAPTGDERSHGLLLADALAQADALAFGREKIDEPHRHHPGNRPSTLLVYKELSPRILGKLIALYEHKTAIAGAIWGINSFDQWGVELGKRLSGGIRPMVQGDSLPTSSLAPVIASIRRMCDR
jgi:glucose-6-phosphate isomerase